ncbi:molecular chaperone HtpG [Anaerobranca californiensis DSM 14826]|uniref:Chaperone protein HtpG n=1 Tax=Anaerobranca californiensis DSM 14826 TaxID=1120989 RepID=A0A1M6N9Z8_9FIRM|nr:molecular chaperone HtpG [Anaerobranca californiensis]SHJ92550.1 molecular chaperone HtpG [Anaerobranca californiensis DSM 14826]
MEKKQFQAESKRLLDLMINSIYTNKEIFLRELISNASDAIDKMYYKALTDENISFNKEDYYIKVIPDKENRTLTIVDTGIGMTKEELDENLGIIAKSGSLSFKQQNELKDGYDIIGQFGVGFYSAFMVADTVTVLTKAYGENQGYKWESSGADGYTIEPYEKQDRGTEIILKLKENSEDEDYDQFLDQWRLKNIIKKYSDFIRYPIKMDVTKKVEKEGSKGEYIDVVEEETINSMVPIWRKNKNELTEEDYHNFYQEKRFGFDKPLKYIHMAVDGTISFNAILYIPENVPFDFYTKDYEKGLELYSKGILIMNRCPDLLPDYFSFVKGMVDSEDLSLNISREMLQQDRQLRIIAKRIKDKIKNELLSLLKNEREKYEKFFQNFGRQLKYGVYENFGQNKEDLQDLLMFYSSTEKKLVTLEEYISRMKEGQKYIYYASGESIERIEKMPQTEVLKEKGYEILFFTDDVDEFAIKMLREYKEKEFKSVSSGDLGIEELEGKTEEKESEEIFKKIKEVLGDKVKGVKPSKILKSHPVCLTVEGDISIEMEKILANLPNNPNIKAQRVLEINTEHNIFKKLKEMYEKDRDKFNLYVKVLYDQALLIEGLPIEDPVEYANNVSELLL